MDLRYVLLWPGATTGGPGKHRLGIRCLATQEEVRRLRDSLPPAACNGFGRDRALATPRLAWGARQGAELNRTT